VPAGPVGYRGDLMTEPPDERFVDLVRRAIASIPAPFADQLGSVAIVVEDEPTAGQLARTGSHGLFGLYEGVPRTAYGATMAAHPSKITIFRGPLERAFRDPERLAAAVEDTVLHEVAHHLGISDARLRELRR
jgi:predicted Zn-dependent protease with MMP-like domain